MQSAQPAHVVECDGCEENCFMPVTVYPIADDRPARAFITCDKRDDIGRVRVDFHRMKQWQCTGELVANALCRLLSFAIPPATVESSGWMLGTIKSKKKHNSAVKLRIVNRAVLQVGGHDVALADLLTFADGTVSLDKDALFELASKPVASPIAPKYSPSTAKRDARKLATQERYANWQKAYRKIKRDHPNKLDSWIAAQIFKDKDIAKGASVGTIRKNMKP